VAGQLNTGGSLKAARPGSLHRRPRDTRQRALRVAEALFADRGYWGTSLRDIARRIGIKAPSLLHHFSSKEQLYLAVLDRIFAGLEEAAQGIVIGGGSYQERARRSIAGAIEFVARRPDFVRIIWKEMADQRGIGRALLKRRLPPLFALAANFVFRGQREGEFRSEVDPFHFLLSLNSITLGYFTTATMVRRLWNVNLLEPAVIERRKKEVIDLVERTLFVPRHGSRRN